MKISVKYLILILVCVSLFNCKRAKNKLIEVKDKTESKIDANTEKIKQKIFPTFDSEIADTEDNKQRFKEFINVELSDDVNNILCFDDAIGIDTDYMFTFNCDKSTSKKIIVSHKLELDKNNPDYGFGLQHEFDWWNKERIAELEKYSWTNGNGYTKYYWYDSENQKAYFFEFTI